MKNKDIIILKKILDYCSQLDEACDMFDNDYNNFLSNSVFQNACCMCILQIGELCKVISEELRMQEKVVPWKEWCGIRDIFAHQYSNLDCQSAWDTKESKTGSSAHIFPALETPSDRQTHHPLCS